MHFRNTLRRQKYFFFGYFAVFFFVSSLNDVQENLLSTYLSCVSTIIFVLDFNFFFCLIYSLILFKSCGVSRSWSGRAPVCIMNALFASKVEKPLLRMSLGASEEAHSAWSVVYWMRIARQLRCAATTLLWYVIWPMRQSNWKTFTWRISRWCSMISCENCITSSGTAADVCMCVSSLVPRTPIAFREEAYRRLIRAHYTTMSYESVVFFSVCI